jgi:hypothetical protein
MEPWAVQLLTLLGVAVGALASFISTRLLDRSRWQREEALRWDTRRLECYSEFGSDLRRFIAIAHRIAAGLGFPSNAQPLDSASGLAALADAEDEVSVKEERLLMFGSPAVVEAAQEWRRAAWHLEWFARGRRNDLVEYTQANQERREAQSRFYSVVRADLGIVSEIPDRKEPGWLTQLHSTGSSDSEEA